jgi:hemerythrin-like domain-containing protein
MAIRIGAKPESDFNNPLGLMRDCHRHVEKFLHVLTTVTEQAHGGALNPEQREALGTALRYFEKAAPLHTADEEVSLFPRLRAANSAGALAALDALESDHREAEPAHAEVDLLGRKWLAEGALSQDEARRLAGLLRTLQETYRAHIAVEDDEVFPLAGRALAPSALREVGREMAARRGLDPDHPSPISRCAARRLAREAVARRAGENARA